MTSEIIFVGSMNLGFPPDDGETMKNVILSNEMEKYVDKVYRIDVRHRPKRYYYLLKFIILILSNRDAKVIFSASSMVVYTLLKVAKMLCFKNENIYYWVIGGKFGSLVENKDIDASYYVNLHKIIVEGESMKQQLENAGFKNAMVLPNIKTIDYLPTIQNKTCKPAKFVFLSRVMPQKGVDYIIEAAHKLAAGGKKEFIVDIYGRIDPSYEDDFTAKLKDDPNVSYKGFLMLNEHKGYDTLASYDAMLFPTYWHGEGFPGIIIDAFVAGLPVIASEWNLNTSLIKDSYNGIIIPVHNVDALASSMEDIIDGKTDINTLSANAQKDAMKYEVGNVINAELLREIEIIK